MPLKFTDDQRRWLIDEYDLTRQHIFAWETGTFPGPKWMPVILRVTGKTYEEVRALYPEIDSPKNVGVVGK